MASTTAFGARVPRLVLLRWEAPGVGEATIDPLDEIRIGFDTVDVHVEPASNRAAPHLHQLDAGFEEVIACVWIRPHDEATLAAGSDSEVPTTHERHTAEHLLFRDPRLAPERVSEAICQAFVGWHGLIVWSCPGSSGRLRAGRKRRSNAQ